MASSGVPAPPSYGRALRSWWPWVGLLLMLGVTVSAWVLVRQAELARIQALQVALVHAMAERVKDRMQTFEQV
ncbi:MAG TPA: hypothetical protein VJ486_12660, partial [Geothrix sp.]|nr:hypothetical protein [Geothrix sp.]